jgi:hypothetical protein
MLVTKANFLIGAETGYFFTPALYLSGGIVYDLIVNPKYKRRDNLKPIIENNFSFNINMKWQW